MHRGECKRGTVVFSDLFKEIGEVFNNLHLVRMELTKKINNDIARMDTLLIDDKNLIKELIYKLMDKSISGEQADQMIHELNENIESFVINTIDLVENLKKISIVLSRERIKFKI